MAKKKEGGVTLERGSVYFFYRPKVEEEDPGSLSELQRFYMVMSPEKRDRYRLAVIGRKRLPHPGRSGGARSWGFVDIVRKNPKSIAEELGGEVYGTKTRGQRHAPAARPAGEGVYRIVRHDDHTHFVYALELPKSTGEVQEDLRLEEQASYVISIKNPERGSPVAVGLGEDRQAKFSKKLMERFRGRRFSEADPPDFLDKQGAEFLLISASEDVKEELGITLETERESAASADIFKDLKVDKKARPTEPLFKGKWE